MNRSTDGDDVVLVDEAGDAIGRRPKMAAHAAGERHRAISIFVYDTGGRLLIQRRASGKYHFAGLWANTACSHPRPGERVLEAARRRLYEEMGIEVDVREVGTFTYRAEDTVSGLVEHEFDHVLVGVSDEEPRPDPGEVDAYDHVDPARLALWIRSDPDRFVPWLVPAFEALPVLTEPDARPEVPDRP